MDTNVLNQYLSKALEWIQTGGAWVSSQIPSYVTELLTYYTIEKTIFAILFIVITLLFLFFFIVFCKICAKDDAEEGTVLAIILFFVLTIGSFVASMNYTLDAIKIRVAPKVWLVEYVTDKLSPSK